MSTIKSVVHSVMPYERLLLFEILVLVSNTLDDSAQRAQFVGEIIAEPLDRWTSQRVSDICNDPNW